MVYCVYGIHIWFVGGVCVRQHHMETEVKYILLHVQYINIIVKCIHVNDVNGIAIERTWN